MATPMTYTKQFFYSRSRFLSPYSYAQYFREETSALYISFLSTEVQHRTYLALAFKASEWYERSWSWVQFLSQCTNFRKCKRSLQEVLHRRARFGPLSTFLRRIPEPL